MITEPRDYPRLRLLAEVADDLRALGDPHRAERIATTIRQLRELVEAIDLIDHNELDVPQSVWDRAWDALESLRTARMPALQAPPP